MKGSSSARHLLAREADPLSPLRPILLAAAALLVQLPLLAEGVGGMVDHTVVATNFQWTPRNLTIAPGDTVTFTNGGGTHTFVSDSGDGATCNLPCARTYATAGRYDYHCGIHPTMRGTVSVGTPPSVSISSPAADDTVSGTVTVSGSASHATETIRAVEISLGGAYVTSAFPALDGTWSATVDTASRPNGATTLAARAVTSPTDLAAETSIGVTVSNPAKVDLRALQLTGSTTGILGATLTYRVDNAGNSASGPFGVAFEYFYKGTWRPAGGFTHASLPAFSETTGNFPWNSGLHVGRYPIRIVLDPAGAVAETSETNNVAEGTAAWFTSAIPGVDPLEP